MGISKKIFILFLISFILMSIIGFWIDSINTKRIDDLIKEKYLKISNELLLNIDNATKIEELLNKYKLKPITDETNNNNTVLYYKKHTFGFVSIQKKSFEDEFILHINFLDEHLILKTPNEQNVNEQLQLNILIFLDTAMLFVIFLYILKLLSPLKEITKKIESFSKGELSARIDIHSNDEIGTLSKTFNTMAQTLENLIKTREDLLRDIGHELRTPIAKGKFAIEKIDDFSQKELLKKIFIDLENLTNELIELEKLNSQRLNYTIFSAETLILEALNKLYITDESTISLVIKNDFKITGDLHYLCLALKNIIDNALKYATILPICIAVSKNRIKVSNQAKPLTKELEYYLKPFTQELSQRGGFGLGLSIVHKVLHKHHFGLKYNHFNEQNHFEIVFLVS
ncbi:MAG: ArsS family sensor histidine kinase [Arcobacteraceae bacterium]